MDIEHEKYSLARHDPYILETSSQVHCSIFIIVLLYVMHVSELIVYASIGVI